MFRCVWISVLRWLIVELARRLQVMVFFKWVTLTKICIVLSLVFSRVSVVVPARGCTEEHGSVLGLYGLIIFLTIARLE